jgi:hypothetical protein
LGGEAVARSFHRQDKLGEEFVVAHITIKDALRHADPGRFSI